MSKRAAVADRTVGGLTSDEAMALNRGLWKIVCPLENELTAHYVGTGTDCPMCEAIVMLTLIADPEADDLDLNAIADWLEQLKSDRTIHPHTTITEGR